MSGKRTFLDVKEMADFWEGYQTGAGLTDWEHGEFSAHKYDPVYGATSNTVYGVEFCANDIETHLKPQSQDPYQTAIDRLVGQEVRLSDVVRSRLTPPPTPPPSPPLAVDPVAPAEIDAWYAALAPNEKAMGLRWLHDRARADHPGRKVVRKLVEKFVEGRKTGRPSGR